jgi:C4-dicarboxylate-specific signal transduction histidine kinase
MPDTSIATTRAAINRSNSQYSTGPRTPEGKARSSRNALCHGLTSRAAVLPSEDPAAYQRHCRQFLDEYQPATPTETHLAQELADTSWRLNRIPALEADLLHRAANPLNQAAAIAFDIVDAHRALAMLGMHGQRLSRQFQKALQQLREIQADRLERRERDLKHAADVSELHKHKGIPYDPAEDGFVFSNSEVEAYAQRLVRHNESRTIGYLRFRAHPQSLRAAAG